MSTANQLLIAPQKVATEKFNDRPPSEVLHVSLAKVEIYVVCTTFGGPEDKLTAVIAIALLRPAIDTTFKLRCIEHSTFSFVFELLFKPTTQAENDLPRKSTQRVIVPASVSQGKRDG